MNPPEPHVGTGVTVGIVSEADQYHEAYRWRRERSTMADVAQKWLCAQALDWATGRDEATPLRILSVGCGDGNLDLPLLHALRSVTDVAYTGVDVNPHSLAVFREALGDLPATLLETTMENLPPVAEPYDLVIVSHVLYYVDEPAGLVSRLLCEFTRTDGHLVVIHSAFDGIPSLMASVEGMQPFLTAEDIAEGLTARDLPPAWHRLHTELDATDLLAGTPEGLAVLEFCIESELEALTPEAQARLHTELKRRCAARGTRSFLPEEVGVLVLGNPLRTATPEVPAPRHDPLEDYHQLAEAFAWPERLTVLPRSADGQMHLLDVGCGTGRWLRVLRSSFPELAQGAARDLRYSLLDPIRPATESAANAAAAMFTVGDVWNDYVQAADLPTGRFGLIWAIHSLYGVPRGDLAEALAHMLRALHPEGTAIIVLPDDSSFYVEAAVQLLGHTVFTSADDVRAELDTLGFSYQVRHVRYDECIPAIDEITLRHYVWVESIGKSFVPGGDRDDLPPLPTGPWWEGHRRGAVFAFPQNVEVITIRGGQ